LPFRYRGSRRESAVAQLFSLGVRDDLADWCQQQKMPLVIEDHALVEFD
jgi:hypothetical protein